MRRALAILFAACFGVVACKTSPMASPLVVFNAGSLAAPFRELLNGFVASHPNARVLQESSGSLEAARKLTELGKTPDVLAVADYGVIAKLLMPSHVTWYATFASNAMVLAYTDRSNGAGEISADNWWRILLRPEVRWGSSDPSLDPNGYRTLLVFQLAASHYHVAGLAQRLRAAMRPRYVRPSEAQLIGLLQANELDYAWSYRSLAATAGLRWVALPPEIDLSDPSRAAFYSSARIRLPGPRLGQADSVEFKGEPILYALTIPIAAPHPEMARAFVAYVLSGAGQEILRRTGFVVLQEPVFTGTPPELPNESPPHR